jgi:hypothetical protein
MSERCLPLLWVQDRGLEPEFLGPNTGPPAPRPGVLASVQETAAKQEGNLI